MPYGLEEPIKPVIIQKIPETECMMLSINVPQNDLRLAFTDIEKTWKQMYPTLPFEGYYQSDSYQSATYINEGIFKQFSLMAIFGLFLSISGLFAIVSLNINKRIKEIGIRKVLGASVTQIIRLINKEYLIILVISSILGSGMGYYFMNLFLGNIYDYYVPIGPWIFIVSILVIFISAIITSGNKVIKAALTNPTESLRYE